MKKSPVHAPSKPHLRTRKLSPTGKSAFPPTPPSAFGDPSSDASPAQPAFASTATPSAAPGDIGG